MSILLHGKIRHFLKGLVAVWFSLYFDGFLMVNAWNGFLGAILKELLIMEECLILLCSLSPHDFVVFILLLLHGFVSQSLLLRKYIGVSRNRHSKFQSVVCKSEAKRLSRQFRRGHHIALTGRGLSFNSVLFPLLCFDNIMFHLMRWILLSVKL